VWLATHMTDRLVPVCRHFSPIKDKKGQVRDMNYQEEEYLIRERIWEEEQRTAKKRRAARVKRANQKMRLIARPELWGQTEASRNCSRICRQQRRALGKMDINGFYAKCYSLGWHCRVCGKELTKDTVTIDHIVPVSRGGTNDIENLQPMCHSCNSRKGNRPMNYVIGSAFLSEQ
jgi:5-methylcytosine-specific restriction endonuclease McrA